MLSMDFWDFPSGFVTALYTYHDSRMVTLKSNGSRFALSHTNSLIIVGKERKLTSRADWIMRLEHVEAAHWTRDVTQTCNVTEQSFYVNKHRTDFCVNVLYPLPKHIVTTLKD